MHGRAARVYEIRGRDRPVRQERGGRGARHPASLQDGKIQPGAERDARLRLERRRLEQFEGSELYGKTLGIIGLGRIGGLVSQRAHGFAMQVIAYDPYIPDSRFGNLNVEKRETLEELLRESDYITIHTPRTKETMNMISDDADRDDEAGRPAGELRARRSLQRGRPVPRA